MTEKERIIFERGFEEGYAVARRNYESFNVHITTKNGLPIKRILSPKEELPDITK